MSGINSSRFLIDSAQFKEIITAAIQSAKTRVLVQAMTFESDDAGNWLLENMVASNARIKTLCVDAYSLVNINDHLVYSLKYLKSQDFRKEVRETRAILKSVEWDGVRIHVTNRIGWKLYKYPFRNHKKMLIIDDVAYIGGLNFSDHNFEWHDFMMRIDDPKIVNELSNDFESTLSGKNQSFSREFENTNIYFLDGSRSRNVYDDLFSILISAKKQVVIMSPYVSDPLLSKLKLLNSSVEIQVVTPQSNNKSLMQDLLFSMAKRSKIDVRLYEPGMSHLKAILVDDNKLIVGSSNFDFVSYELEQELVLVTQDKNAIADFKESILKPDLAKSQKLNHPKESYLSVSAIFVARKFIELLGFFYRKGHVR